MALIQCPECAKEISDKAAACPHCGNPIATPSVAIAVDESTIVTTQETSKELKLQQLIGAAILVGGVGFVFIGPDSGRTFGAFVAFCGIIWYLGARVAVWWKHG